MKKISEIELSRLREIAAGLPQRTQKGIHSELHEFINVTRKEWSDQVPFGRWLGLCKDVPLTILYQLRGSVREIASSTPAKLFFWKVRAYQTARIQKK